MQNREGSPFWTAGLAIGLCFALLFVSCEDAPVGEKKPEQCRARAGDVLQPLVKGNYWQWTHDVTGNNSGPDTNRTFVDGKMQVEIDGTSYTASILKSTNPTTGSVEEESRLLWNGPKGLYTLGMIAPKDTLLIEPHLQYKYPVSAGEAWQLLLMVYNDIEGEVEVADTVTIKTSILNEVFTAPSGTFNTVVYHYYFRPSFDIASYWHYFEYFSPGIGHVGTGIYSYRDSTLRFRERNNSSKQVTAKLLNYCLN